ncbi:hypothetical protein [Aeromicrobium sp. Sec7.5]|uniref:hypothetical protein n=1 Tax=Aeromicrobium sp. Sec7.5 TaxID=3121276 RepID=UPI002FE44D08
MTRTLQRTTLGIAAALTALVLAGCGGDDDAGGGSSPQSGTGSGGDSGSDTASLSDVEIGLDTLGYAIEAAMGNVDGYEVDGSTLRIQINDDYDEYLSSECLIIETVAGSTGLPPDAEVELEYDDGTTTSCDV